MATTEEGNPSEKGNPRDLRDVNLEDGKKATGGEMVGLLIKQRGHDRGTQVADRWVPAMQKAHM